MIKNELYPQQYSEYILPNPYTLFNSTLSILSAIYIHRLRTEVRVVGLLHLGTNVILPCYILNYLLLVALQTFSASKKE